MVRSVLIAAPSGNPAAVVNVQSLAFGAVPAGGPGTCQPPVSPLSNEVEPSPVDTVTSSTNAPSPWVAQSLAYEIETSTCLPAKAARSTFHSCQPAESPEAAFQAPDVPVGVHADGPLCVW